MALKIFIKYFDKNMPKLERIEQRDWIDLRSREAFTYKAGDFIKVPLEVAMELPKGYEAHIVPRSSTFKNFGLIMVNSPGIVDESYKGDNDEWFAPFLAFRDGKNRKIRPYCAVSYCRKNAARNIRRERTPREQGQMRGKLNRYKIKRRGADGKRNFTKNS